MPMSSRRPTPCGHGLVAGVSCTMAGCPRCADTPGAACLRLPDEPPNDWRASMRRRESGRGRCCRAGSSDAPAGAATQPRPVARLRRVGSRRRLRRRRRHHRASLIDSAWGFLPDSRKAYVRLLPAELPAVRPLHGRRQPRALRTAVRGLCRGRRLRGRRGQVPAQLQGTPAHDARIAAGVCGLRTPSRASGRSTASDISRPFRETNYMPELFGSFRPGIELGSFRWNVLNFGYTHQSNGRADPISRSWDRLFVEAGIERDNFARRRARVDAHRAVELRGRQSGHHRLPGATGRSRPCTAGATTRSR